MRTMIGIVYDKLTGEIRRIVVPDQDDQLAAHSKVGLGEAFLIESYDGPTDLQSIAAIIQRRTGLIR